MASHEELSGFNFFATAIDSCGELAMHFYC